MSRGCWCKKDKDTCPVHVLLPWLLRLPPQASLFPGISPWGALRTMRRMLVILKVPDAGKYCVHDFRRGHALDLQLSGACLSDGWFRVRCVCATFVCTQAQLFGRSWRLASGAVLSS